MSERLSHDDISNALAELIVCFGVKEDTHFDDFHALLRKKDTVGCVQGIASQLGLPIRINLSFVPKDFNPDYADGFRSSALARTDSSGRGIEGIVAQVSIPQHLPMFGSSGLQGFPIQVRVSEDCHAHPAAFLATMVHELSHVLLAALRSPHKDSEFHTDLVPILLGFRGFVRIGRKTIDRQTSGNTTTTRTTTYGYLTDAQFDFACNYVTGVLERHRRDRDLLLEMAEQVQRKLKKSSRSLATFRDYFRYLDIHPPERMRKKHAERVIQLHGRDYSLEWERGITAARKSMGIAEAFARPQDHHWPSDAEQIKTQMRVLEAASQELDNITQAIAKDEHILRKYVGFTYRLRRTLGRHS